MIGCPVNVKRHDPYPDQKVVIFDSPDGTGKTNISQALARDLKVPYFRMPTQHDNWRKNSFKTALEFDQVYMAEFLKQTGTSVIIDRAYPSEWVYSQVYGRETNMSVLERVDFEYARMGAVIIIPLRHDYSKNRKDEVVSNDILPALHKKYEEFRSWTKCNTITIFVDAFDNKLERELDAIKQELKFDRNAPPFSFNTILDKAVEQKSVQQIWDELANLNATHSRQTDLKRGI